MTDALTMLMFGNVAASGPTCACLTQRQRRGCNSNVGIFQNCRPALPPAPAAGSLSHSPPPVYPRLCRLPLMTVLFLQLLVSLSFSQMVKLHSLKCQGPPGGQAPKTIKLFINQPNALDFDTANDGIPLQEIM